MTNCVGRQLSGFEGQQHPGRIDGIQESEGVADEHPAVSGDALRAVGKILNNPDGKTLLGAGHALLEGRTIPDLRFEPNLGVAPSPQQVFQVAYHPDAHDVAGERDVPEPRIPVPGVHDQGRPFVDAGVAPGAPKVREDGDLLEVRLRYPKSQFPGEEGIASGGVHHHPRRNLRDGSRSRPAPGFRPPAPLRTSRPVPGRRGGTEPPVPPPAPAAGHRTRCAAPARWWSVRGDRSPRSRTVRNRGPKR